MDNSGDKKTQKDDTKARNAILDGASDVKKTWSDFRRLGFSDETGNYGYSDGGQKPRWDNRICTKIDTNSESTKDKFKAFSKKVKCAEAKYKFSNNDANDNKNRKKIC